jgi:hypothetical protein
VTAEPAPTPLAKAATIHAVKWGVPSDDGEEADPFAQGFVGKKLL